MAHGIETRHDIRGASWMVGLITCVLILLTFSFAPSGSDSGELGAVAYIKLAARLIAILLLAVLVFSHWNWSFRRSWPILSLLVPLVVFVLYAIASTLWSPLRSVTLGQSVSLFALVLLCAGHAILAQNDQHFPFTMKVLNLSLYLVMSAALFVHVVLPSFGTISRESIGLMHPTNAAASASLGLVLLLAANMIWGWSWSRWLLIPGLLVYSAVIFVAVNRWAPLVTLPIAAALLLTFGQRTVTAVLAVVMSVFITGCVAVDPSLTFIGDVVPAAEAYAKRGQSKEQLYKFSGREEMWRAMWKSHLDSPWIGHGYFVSSRTGRMEVWNDVGNRTAHNMVLQVLVTCGRVGLLLFLCGLLWPILHVTLGLAGRFGDWRLLTFLALTLVWYVGWGLLNESIAGPVQPESIVFYSLLGMGIGVADRRLRAARHCTSYSCRG